MDLSHCHGRISLGKTTGRTDASESQMNALPSCVRWLRANDVHARTSMESWNRFLAARLSDRNVAETVGSGLRAIDRTRCRGDAHRHQVAVRHPRRSGRHGDFLAQGQFPVVRGLQPTRDDLLRRSVIMALMCQGRPEFESVEHADLVNFREAFATERVEVTENAIQVTATGGYVVRAVAMVFDRHLQVDPARQRLSRIL